MFVEPLPKQSKTCYVNIILEMFNMFHGLDVLTQYWFCKVQRSVANFAIPSPSPISPHQQMVSKAIYNKTNCNIYCPSNQILLSLASTPQFVIFNSVSVFELTNLETCTNRQTTQEVLTSSCHFLCLSHILVSGTLLKLWILTFCVNNNKNNGLLCRGSKNKFLIIWNSFSKIKY